VNRSDGSAAMNETSHVEFDAFAGDFTLRLQAELVEQHRNQLIGSVSHFFVEHDGRHNPMGLRCDRWPV
jgi:hypothetical protein